jgi:hypothetical protein
MCPPIHPLDADIHLRGSGKAGVGHLHCLLRLPTPPAPSSKTSSIPRVIWFFSISICNVIPAVATSSLTLSFLPVETPVASHALCHQCRIARTEPDDRSSPIFIDHPIPALPIDHHQSSNRHNSPDVPNLNISLVTPTSRDIQFSND